MTRMMMIMTTKMNDTMVVVVPSVPPTQVGKYCHHSDHVDDNDYHSYDDYDDNDDDGYDDYDNKDQ